MELESELESGGLAFSISLEMKTIFESYQHKNINSCGLISLAMIEYTLSNSSENLGTTIRIGGILCKYF